MKKTSNLVFLACFFISLAGCASLTWDNIKPDPKFKQITPVMEVQMRELRAQGCTGNYEILDSEVAFLYSLIPGGGQFYTGETKKAWWYLFGTVLIVPYFISFDDAQNTVDYLNFRYTIDYCTEKLRLVREVKKQEKQLKVLE